MTNEKAGVLKVFNKHHLIFLLSITLQKNQTELSTLKQGEKKNKNDLGGELYTEGLHLKWN